ncbi:hypothetical protein GCM10009016_08370 [Halomonas beimenensis]
MRGRGVINLTAPPDVITRRIAIRYRQTGKILKYHEGKSEYELQEFNSTALQQRDELCGLMREVGCPTISIDVSESNFTRSWVRGFKETMSEVDVGIRGCHL